MWNNVHQCVKCNIVHSFTVIESTSKITFNSYNNTTVSILVLPPLHTKRKKPCTCVITSWKTTHTEYHSCSNLSAYYNILQHCCNRTHLHRFLKPSASKTPWRLFCFQIVSSQHTCNKIVRPFLG